MSEQIARMVESGRGGEGHPLPLGDDDEDWIDTGSAILDFYCTLVDLLGRYYISSRIKVCNFMCFTLHGMISW